MTGQTPRRAITIIEIVVVVAIISLLAAVVLKISSAVNYNSQMARADQTTRLLGEAVEAFRDSEGFYPLVVPYDAWDPWSSFSTVMGWANRWTNYFDNEDGHPAFDWAGQTDPDEIRPVNIDMLWFQLEQVDESRRILESIRKATRLDTYKNIDVTGGNERWPVVGAGCRLGRAVDRALANVYQIQDPWGLPYRFWTSDILKWAKNTGAWGSDIQELVASNLEASGWTYYFESAGRDSLFGWWGASESVLDRGLAADNIYSSSR